jgi:hypothetical protein
MLMDSNPGVRLNQIPSIPQCESKTIEFVGPLSRW